VRLRRICAALVTTPGALPRENEGGCPVGNAARDRNLFPSLPARGQGDISGRASLPPPQPLAAPVIVEVALPPKKNVGGVANHTNDAGVDGERCPEFLWLPGPSRGSKERNSHGDGRHLCTARTPEIEGGVVGRPRRSHGGALLTSLGQQDSPADR